MSAELAVAPSTRGVRLLRQQPLAALALGWVLLVALAGLFAPLLAPFPPIRTGIGPAFAAPGWPYLLGTDDLGRDIFSGVLHGARISMGIGIATAAASSAIGLVVGLVAGYRGGWIDILLMRVTEVFMVIPMVFLAILLVAFFGGSLWNVLAVIVLLSWPATARLVRGQVLSLKERDYVRAALLLGETHGFVMFREILPNTLAPIVVNASIQMAHAIVVEAGLSFLGLGDPEVTSWGMMLYRAQRFMLGDAWWTFICPGLALFLTVLALNVLADGLNAVLNPRSRGR